MLYFSIYPNLFYARTTDGMDMLIFFRPLRGAE